MATTEQSLGRPESPRVVATDGRAWLLALAGLAALVLSGLISAQVAPPDRTWSATVSTDDHSRWASPGPRWRSRSQILEDAGILQQP